MLFSRKFFYLFTCEFCFSHWVTALSAAHHPLQAAVCTDWRGYLIAGFSLVWLANVYMSFFGRLRLEIREDRIEIAAAGTIDDSRNTLTPAASSRICETRRFATLSTCRRPLTASSCRPTTAAGSSLMRLNRFGRSRAPTGNSLIVDDGSTDDTLASVPPDPRIRLISRPHTGNVAAVRNAGLDSARGAFIGFLDSDDRWRPEKLTRQLARLQARPDCGWCYGAHVLIDPAGRPMPARPTDPRWSPREGDLFPAVVLAQAGIAMQTVLARRAVALAVHFDERIPWGDDYDFRLRLAHQAPACVVDDVVAEVREHPERGSSGPRGYHVHAAQVRALRKCGPWLTDKELRRAARRRMFLEARHFLANARAAHAVVAGCRSTGRGVAGAGLITSPAGAAARHTPPSCRMSDFE